MSYQRRELQRPLKLEWEETPPAHTLPVTLCRGKKPFAFDARKERKTQLDTEKLSFIIH